MTSRKDQDEEDRAAFLEAMRGVRPLQGPNRVLPQAIPKRPPRQRPARARPGAPARPDGAGPAYPVQAERTGETVKGRASGADHRLLSRLRRGEIPPEARLDLHGLRGQDAGPRVESFVLSCWQAGKRCLLIVHGRGHGSGPMGPILGPLVMDTLTSGALTAAVLAFCSAPQRLGGTGAMLVYLRKPPG